MPEEKIEKDISTMSFEEAMGELESLVKRLEMGQASLEDAIKDYERGASLQKHCEMKLKDASLKIEKITKNQGGELSAVTME